MNNTTTAEFGFKKSQLSKVNQKIYKNILLLFIFIFSFYC